MSAILKEFRPNTRYVFSKSRFIKDLGLRTYEHSKEWVNEADGKEINIYRKTFGYLVGGIATKNHHTGYYDVVPMWCKVVR